MARRTCTQVSEGDVGHGREARLRDMGRPQGRLVAHSNRIEKRINVMQEAQAAPAPEGLHVGKQG